VPQALRSDEELLAALRAGDEQAFMELVDEWHSLMVRVARSHVPTLAVAEEVVQETWLGVLEGLDRFEGRSSLKTWVFRILVNRGITRGERERRTVPFSSLVSDDVGHEEPAVDPDRFLGGAWNAPAGLAPRPWSDSPERLAIESETVGHVRAAIDELPEAQRAVIVLRDVAGFTAEEACDLLGVSNGNQRVLLHRARSGVRSRVEAEPAA
jgi:RNA polymerase sigma-70 factor (ECF subfamily)